jgi:hypothetical protein
LCSTPVIYALRRSGDKQHLTAMKKPRTSTVIIACQIMLFLICLGFLGFVLFDNYFLKMEAKRYAAMAGFDQATRNFLRGDYCLYEIKLFKVDAGYSGTVPTDGTTQPAGKMDGQFQVRYFLVDENMPKWHQKIQQAFVDGYNDHMRGYFEHPEWFDKNGQRIPLHELQKQTTNSAKYK